MKLNKVLDSEKICEIKGSDNPDEIEVSGVFYDSREVKPDGMFVAIPGFKTDGHAFIPRAIESGAKVIVCQDLPENLEDGVVYVKVDDARASLGRLASNFYGHPSEKLITIGVTGTNGKTSTTSLAKDIFTEAGYKGGMSGTIFNQIGYEILDNKARTTPESRDLQALLNDMVSEDCKVATIECSSHALDLNRLNGTSFDYAIFTNLTQDHLDYHKTMENYFDAKSKLFSMSTKANIVDIDEKWGQVLYGKLKENETVPVISYGFSPEADYRIEDVDLSLNGSDFNIVTPEGKFHVSLPIIGKVMASNALAASIPALLEGIEPETVARALTHPSKVEGRFDLLNTEADFDIIIDYAHSPDSLEKLLQSVREIHDGRIVLVFGANGDRDKTKRPIMGRIAGENADLIVVTSDNPASEDPQAIIDMVVEGIKESGTPYEMVLTRSEGIYRGAQLCEPGDVLVLAGKGHEHQEILKDETLYYDEWETAYKAVDKLLGQK